MIVAKTRSKMGGHCQRCRKWINKGEPIFKIPREGPPTKAGHGAGDWVCYPCAMRHEHDESKKKEEHDDGDGDGDI